MITYDDDNLHVRFGDNGLQDVEAYLASTPRTWAYCNSEDYANRYEWDMGAGYAGAMRMARVGWSEGAASIDDGLRAFPAPTTHHADLRYDYGGHLPDVPRYLSGDPAHMVTRGKRTGNPPVIHIVLNTITVAGVTSAEYMNFGLALAAVIDKLEASGRRIELDVLSTGTTHGRYRICVGWKVKRAGEQADFSNIAFSVAHTAAYRRLGFALMERAPRHTGTPSYRTPGEITKRELEVIEAENALAIDGIRGSAGICATKQGALAFAVRVINAAAKEEIVTLED